MNKKLLASILVALALMGCENSSRQIDFPVKPKELEDCTFHRLHSKGENSITVARCPLSTTTTSFSQGKTTASVVVIDGVTYEVEIKQN